ncbi:MAG: PilT/PilU family type 4a pilus ATPase [Gammaproteobacteria bacterium]|nr:PilT/PilU family type 4a pilus ATPase [Gammaproteobacteria bacterium]
MAQKNASDLFFSVGAPPHMKIEGVSTPMGQAAMPPGSIKEIAYKLMDAEQIREFEQEWELNFAYSVPEVGRFRVNVFRQRGEVGMVMRHIKSQIPAFESLGLPKKITELVMERSGLVLVCGPTGSGKSTTLAAMVDFRNRRDSSHILTIEDPIEFLHDHRMSIVDQREIGVDTRSYRHALKNAMREAPDVILIGEIRDTEAMEYALSYAQTGHLVLATIHGNNSKQVLERVRNFFETENRGQVMKELSGVLRGIVSQRLVRGIDGKRICATEILLMAPEIGEIVQRGFLEDLHKAIDKNYNDGMMTFDQSLFNLYQRGAITKELALHNAESRTDLSLRMRLGATGSPNPEPKPVPATTPAAGGEMRFDTEL